MAKLSIASIAVPPGATIAEQLEIRDMTQKELALRLGISVKHMNEIIRGKSPITWETALKLESVLGLPASFWTGLESTYQLAKTRQSREFFDKEEDEIARSIDYAEIAKKGWVPKARSIQKKIENLRLLFGVANLRLIPKLIPVAFRKSEVYESSGFALAAWLRKGELTAQSIQTSAYNKSKLRKTIPELRKLTGESFGEATKRLTNLLSDCGIALAVVPHISKTYANGAVKRINPEKVLLQISLMGVYTDIFWFSLFHELGHIYLEHLKKETIIDFPASNTDQEKEADDFAKNILIPACKYQNFITGKTITKENILSFAEEIEIHPGIIIGRLMHENKIRFNQFNNLREKALLNKNNAAM